MSYNFLNLLKTGILGINKRNGDYIIMYNPRKLYPLVDNKLITKKLALKAKIKVPELYGIIETQRQVKMLPEFLRKYDDFVIKPAQGSGGQGIMVICGHTKNKFRKNNGMLIDDDEVKYHVYNILSGMFSLGGHPDAAIIEYRIEFDPLFEEICYQGVPDIRIIVLLGVPVMSMTRLPTRMSDGKANLHQGAIGAGITIATGKTLTAVFQNEIISEHPDTGKPIANLTIPDWDNLLNLASRCTELTGLGYIGVDIALDKNLGPLILELNARPGLNIQIANRSPLLPMLKLVEKEIDKLKTPSEKVNFAKTSFNY